MFTDPIPTDQQLTEFYTARYRKAYKGVHQPKTYHIYRAGKLALKRLERIRSLVPSGGRVLDIGSGGGEFVYLLAKRGYRATGVEPDVGYGSFSIQEYGIDVQQVPLKAMDLPAGEFDAVTAHHVVEHLRDPFGCFQRVYELLKMGGVFVVHVPNVESTNHAPHHRFHYAHIYNFNPKTMEWMGAKAGFCVHPIGMTSTNGEVRVVFQKCERSLQNPQLEENYYQVNSILQNHTPLRYYCSLAIWRSLGAAIQRMYSEPRDAPFRQFKSGRQILDELYDRNGLSR